MYFLIWCVQKQTKKKQQLDRVHYQGHITILRSQSIFCPKSMKLALDSHFPKILIVICPWIMSLRLGPFCCAFDNDCWIVFVIIFSLSHPIRWCWWIPQYWNFANNDMCSAVTDWSTQSDLTFLDKYSPPASHRWSFTLPMSNFLHSFRFLASKLRYVQNRIKGKEGEGFFQMYVSNTAS